MTPEASALYVESLLARLGKAINTGDLRDKGVEAQLSTLTGAVVTMGQKNQSLETYLVANKTLPANRIRAVGYGPNRPLAPETTPAGRAINRRIDVLITPSQTP